MNRFWKSGVPYVWLTGGALCFCLLMVAGLIWVVVSNGFGFFWPRAIEAFHLSDGSRVMGEVWARQEIPPMGKEGPEQQRIQIKTGNRDAYGIDFRWIREDAITSRETPSEAVMFERREWGNFYGFIQAIYEGDQKVAEGGLAGWQALEAHRKSLKEKLDRIHHIEKDAIGKVNHRIEQARLQMRRMELRGAPDEGVLQKLEQERQTHWREYEILTEELFRLRDESMRYRVEMSLIGGETRTVAIADIVRVMRPNQLGTGGKVAVYVSRLWEFLFHEPRESNTEGGIFPAIFGTLMLVILMSLVSVPFGLLTAIYLREYARQGPLVRLIRIAVNNLAGVPSIVFGIFGLGFFIYGVGGTIDQLFFPEALPAPTYGTGGILWASLTLALLTVPVMIVASEEALAAVTREVREGSLALGSTKFQTIWRVVLPGALPGILTGVILVIARGASEVAPLMITGVVKLAPSLPLDLNWPFLHLDRKFMHLGFHIYDVGFQSPNVEAARPMVFMTTLLLMVLVVSLNIVAIWVRNRLRRKLRVTAL